METFEQLKIGEDREKRRELAVSEISHQIENYVASRLQSAKEKEMLAKMQEEEAKRSLEELQHNEEELKATLGMLKDFKGKKVEEKQK